MNALSELSHDLTTPLLAPAVLDAFDALADGRCSLAEFCRAVLKHCSGDHSAVTGVLLLLEERGDFGNLKHHDFGPLQRALERQQLRATGRAEPGRIASGQSGAFETHAPRSVGPTTVLGDRFVLQEMLGRGGVGTVYRALDRNRAGLPREQQYVALKVLRNEHARRPEALRAFRREFYQALSLSHPGIVNVYDFARDEDIHFVTMELLEGETLAALIKRVVPDNRTRGPAIAMLCELGDAITFAHEHDVVHLDLKPANVFVTARGRIRVIDFGLAQTFMAEPWISDAPPESPAATLPYASCERLAGDLPDVRDDLYSFACIAYELLSGQHPFERRSALEARKEGRGPRRIRGLSGLQWRALKSGLAWSRVDRPGSMRELLQDFAPRRGTSRGRVRRRMRPHRSTVIARLTGALLLCAIALGLVWYKLPEDSRLAVSERTAALGTATRASGEVARDWAVAGWSRLLAATGQARTPVALPTPADVEPPETTSRLTAAAPARVEAELAVSANPVTNPATIDASAIAAIQAEAPPEIAPAVEPPVSAGGPGVLEFRAESFSVDESEAMARLTVRRRGGATGEISFGWHTVDDSAMAEEDYAPAAAQVVMANGQTTATLLVPIVADSTVEHIELFDVVIDEPSGAQLGEITSVPVIIVDDD